MRFGLLGPLQVVDADGVSRAVAAAKQRVVLAALLLGGGTMVSAASLAQAVWDESPPPNAGAALRNYVMRLRRALGPAGGRIVGQPPGWAVELHGPEELDVAEADSLWQAARAAGEAGEWRRMSSLLSTALGLWRGEPLFDVPSPVLVRREGDRLAELRLRLTEARIDADLHMGRHGDLVPELRRLAAGHPLREHLRAQLMLACYRSGQQAAALEAYRDARATLAEELGVEPGHELQDLHQKVLTADPDLAAPAAATVTAGQQRSDQLHGSGPEAVVPRQLPAAVRKFAGRAAELTRLTELAGQARADGGRAVVVISGMAGVGKTALAVHWAHQSADLFPDGQLHVNLEGFTPSGEPADPAGVIRGFLEALGVPAQQVPASAQAQTGLYRSLLASRHMIIVLDNARDAAQARPLLPGAPGCLVLVTSRDQLTGLAATDDAHILRLDVLSDAEAHQMLDTRLGTDRTAAQQDAVTKITSLCGHLPLALAITAARAAARPGHPLAALAAELRDTGSRLDALDDTDTASSIRAVFSWSYSQLSPSSARAFRLLGLHPGPDITVPAMASLAAIAEADAHRLLDELTRAHLITERVPGRYAFHDLLRAYAASQASATDSDIDRSEAIGRVLDHYLHTAASASRLLIPSKEPVVLVPPRPDAAPGQPADYRQALAWFEAEHQVLLAAITLAAESGFDTHAWQLPWALASFLQPRAHYQEWAATQRIALAAATHLGDTAGQAVSSRLLALACADLGHHDEARSHYASSLTLYQRLGDRHGEARVCDNLAVLAERLGHYADALRHAEQALRLSKAVGDSTSEALALHGVGWYHGLLGDFEQARAFGREALTLSAESGHPRLRANILDSLGYAEHHLGNLAEAVVCYQRALNLYSETGFRHQSALTFTHLGDTWQAADELAQAREAWRQALAILDDVNDPDAEKVRAKLAGTD